MEEIMRETLFRGKNKYGEWVIGSLCVANNAVYIVYDRDFTITVSCNNSELVADRYFEVDPETVGQFTGMQDKNGTRIFEHDIIEENYSIGVVRWDEEELEWTICSSSERVIFKLGDFYDYELQVIGNIFDNKELVGVE
jgi:uncharacterized phage protein (TIGR01671 family)